MADPTLPAIGEEVKAGLPAIGSEVPSQPSAEQNQSSIGGAVMVGAKASLPWARNAIEEFATSPTLPKATGAAARALTTGSGIVHGAVTLNPAEVIAAPRVGWAAGKGGYFLGKGAQSVAGPVAELLEKAAPYAQALSTLGGAQGGLDLAQMADPKRQDIGFLGLGKSVHVPGEEPPLINEAVDFLVKKGMSEVNALRALLLGQVKK